MAADIAYLSSGGSHGHLSLLFDVACAEAVGELGIAADYGNEPWQQNRNRG